MIFPFLKTHQYYETLLNAVCFQNFIHTLTENHSCLCKSSLFREKVLFVKYLLILLTCRNNFFGVLGVFVGYFPKNLVKKTLEDYVCLQSLLSTTGKSDLFQLLIQW